MSYLRDFIQETLGKKQETQKNSAKDKLSLSILIPVYNERFLAEESIRRVMAMKSEYLSAVEVLVVDDRSTDGTWEVLNEIKARHPEMKLIRHERNQGKGAAIRTALAQAQNDITIIHDADLEYDPQDIPALIEVFVKEGADAVFGSRYLSAKYRRVLMYRHSLINKTITAFINWLTDLDVTDVETCYKAIKTDLLKSIPIRSRDFRFEVEITMKLAKRRANVFEVPIRYIPRTYEEGKKIRARDGLLALFAALRYHFIEDIFHREHYGLHILLDMNNARQFNQWMADTLRPFLKDKVLEISAGIGNLAKYFIPRKSYIACDTDRHALGYLTSFAIGRPYLKVARLDPENPEDYKVLGEKADTVLMVNVLEQVKDEKTALDQAAKVLEPGGRLVALVSQHPGLYGSFDRTLGYRERYTREKLRKSLEAAGFELEQLFDFNRFTVPSWFWNAKIFKRKRYSLIQLKIREILMPLIRRIDRFFPWSGLSLVAVAKKKA